MVLTSLRFVECLTHPLTRTVLTSSLTWSQYHLRERVDQRLNDGVTVDRRAVRKPITLGNPTILANELHVSWGSDSEQRMTNANTDFDLLLVTSFFDRETCRELITELRHSSAVPAVTYGQGDAGSINERVRKVETLMPSRETVEHVTRRLIDYRQEVGEYFEISLSGCEEPQFLRYRVGDFFVAHQDGNTGLMLLDTDRSRRISISIFLNRESEAPETDCYCGGSLVFSDWRAGRELRLDGETGNLVAFRSETTHEVIPVTYGERYVIVSWYG